MSSSGSVIPNAHAASFRAGGLRVVFIDASIYYVDRRGEHSGILSESTDQQESRCRLNTICANEKWLRAAVALGNDLIDLARRAGDSKAWGCTSGRYGGSNPGPNVMMHAIRAATGLRPHGSVTGPLAPPEDGRWSVRQVFNYEIGDHAPAVAIWHLGFTQNPNFFPLWCEAITAGARPPILLLPDSPIMRESVQRWGAGERRRQGEGWRGDNIRDYLGSAAYVRPRVSTALDIDGSAISGDRLVAAVSFLRARHQLRVSPFDLLRDPLLSTQLGQNEIDDIVWTQSEAATLDRLRVRYERSQRIHTWLEEGRQSPPLDVFSTGDSFPFSIETCLQTAERALATGQIAPVLISSWTGWAPSALERSERPEVPARRGIQGRLVEWYSRMFDKAAECGLTDGQWWSLREEWHAEAYRTFPGHPTEYYDRIYTAERALASQPAIRKMHLEGEFSDWYLSVFDSALQAGIAKGDETGDKGP